MSPLFTGNDQTPVDLTGATIEYHTDQPDLVTVDSNGRLTLLGFTPDMQSISVCVRYQRL